ncbi:hypothetical protein EDB89DRAFT_2245104 [Lactarius sanguifluus]|nr:hypothetical protein EDB89DRAFT_2245104 [Lactarius sanguifluus]
MGRRGRGNENGCGELDIFKGVVEMGDAMETGCRWSKGTRGAGTRGLSSSVYEPIARRSASASMGTWWRTMARKQRAGGESETEPRDAGPRPKRPKTDDFGASARANLTAFPPHRFPAWL